MKITETQLRKLIQESLQEMEMAALEEEIMAEQAEEEEEEEAADLEEAVEESWGGARSGASGTRGIGGKAGGDRGKAQLAQIAQRDAAKKSAADTEAQRAADAESIKKNPFKPTATGMRAMGLAEARKVIAKLVQEVLAEQKKKPQQKKKK